MLIIEEIRDSSTLMKAVERGSTMTKEAFDNLLAFIASEKHKKLMGRIRNNLTFHYDPKTINRTLQTLVDKHPKARGTLSLGHSPIDWYFEPGDMVIDRAVVREIFKVPDGADVQEEMDKNIMQLHDIVQMFGGFAATLIWENAKS